ncbi:MAG: hypothetical protein ABI402_15000 [Ferruginibacter sp.]
MAIAGHNYHAMMFVDFKKRFFLFAFSSMVFFYGGLPFLKGLIDEVKTKSPGKMFLIGFAITVAYAYSVATVFGLTGLGAGFTLTY